MRQKLHKNNKGFTIIEVLIVLAIAGLILLIVFLAVPALQRNARNTSRKNDVARVGGAVQEFINNNNGTLPVNADSATVRGLFGKLGFYQPANITVQGVSTGTALAPQNGTTIDSVDIYTGSACVTNAAGTQGAMPGTTRQIAMTYTLETGGGGGAQTQCTSQ